MTQQDLKDAKAELEASYKAFQEASRAVLPAERRWQTAQLRWTEVSTAFLEEQSVDTDGR